MGFSLQDASILMDGITISTVANEVAVSTSVDDLDVTTFASGGARQRIGGLRTGDIKVNGYVDSTTDTSVYATLASSASVISVSSDGTDGSIAYAMVPLSTNYSTGAAVGQALPFELQTHCRNADGLVRATIVHPGATARTASGNGTARNLGAVATDGKLVCFLHVLSVAGTSTPTLTVAVQSDSGSGMSSPTTVHTFNAATSVGGQWATVQGPITDTYYRVTYTISGTSPSFTFAAGLAVL